MTHSPAVLFCPWPMAEVGSRQQGQRSSKPRSSRWPDVRAPAHCNLEVVTAIFQLLSSVWKETMKKKKILSGTVHLFIDITFFCHTSVSVFNFPKLFNSVSIFSSSWIESSVCVEYSSFNQPPLRCSSSSWTWRGSSPSWSHQLCSLDPGRRSHSPWLTLDGQEDSESDSYESIISHCVLQNMQDFDEGT